MVLGCLDRDSEIDEDFVRLVPDAKDAGPGAAALLIECRGQTPEKLQVQNFGLSCPAVLSAGSVYEPRCIHESKIRCTL